MDRWSDKHRKDTYIALKYQKPTDVKFPTDLILGPEQLDAINSDANVNLLIGEAGSGKTTVLLAILFEFTGKHLKYCDLRKVIFIIPERKVAFTKYVEGFIKEYCIPDCVYLHNFSNLPKDRTNCYYEMLKVPKNNCLIDSVRGSFPNFSPQRFALQMHFEKFQYDTTKMKFFYGFFHSIRIIDKK